VKIMEKIMEKKSIISADQFPDGFGLLPWERRERVSARAPLHGGRGPGRNENCDKPALLTGLRSREYRETGSPKTRR
jgi:hypothetical protein